MREFRTCSKCKEIKTLDEFSGFNYWCKVCRREYQNNKYSEKMGYEKDTKRKKWSAKNVPPEIINKIEHARQLVESCKKSATANSYILQNNI